MHSSEGNSPWVTRWRYEMAAKAGRPGIWRLRGGGFFVRVRVSNPRTGKEHTSATALASALAAVPRDVDSEALTGLQNLADITISFSNLYARRSLTYSSTPPAPPPWWYGLGYPPAAPPAQAPPQPAPA